MKLVTKIKNIGSSSSKEEKESTSPRGAKSPRSLFGARSPRSPREVVSDAKPPHVKKVKPSKSEMADLLKRISDNDPQLLHASFYKTKMSTDLINKVSEAINRNKTVKSYDFEDCNLQDSGLVEILFALERSTVVVKLDFRYNRITRAGLEKLLEYASNNSYVYSIKIKEASASKSLGMDALESLDLPRDLLKQLHKYTKRNKEMKRFEIKESTTLDLSHREIVVLQSFLPSNGSHCQKLLLNNNMIFNIPNGLFVGWNLIAELNLSHNQLSSIPESLSNLKNLENLDFSFNEISSFPAKINQNSKLKQINASNNKITDLPIELGALPFLEMFCIEENPLQDLPANLSVADPLQILEQLRKKWNALQESQSGTNTENNSKDRKEDRKEAEESKNEKAEATVGAGENVSEDAQSHWVAEKPKDVEEKPGRRITLSSRRSAAIPLQGVGELLPPS